MEMPGLFCPDCKSDKHDPRYATDNFFVCVKCGKPLGYYCAGCDKVYETNHLGLHGNVYECKLCGKIQWGYTEYKRKLEKNGRDC